MLDGLEYKPTQICTVNLRVKTETLVASSSIEGDAADDVKFEDS